MAWLSVDGTAMNPFNSLTSITIPPPPPPPPAPTVEPLAIDNSLRTYCYPQMSSTTRDEAFDSYYVQGWGHQSLEIPSTSNGNVLVRAETGGTCEQYAMNQNSDYVHGQNNVKARLTPAGVPQDIWNAVMKAKTFSSYTEAGMIYQQNNDEAVRGVPVLGGRYIAEIECKDDKLLAPVYYCRICPKVVPFSKLITHLTDFDHRLKYLEIHFPDKKADLPEHTAENELLFGIELNRVSFEIIEMEGVFFPELKLDYKMTAEQILGIWTRNELEKPAQKVLCYKNVAQTSVKVADTVSQQDVHPFDANTQNSDYGAYDGRDKGQSWSEDELGVPEQERDNSIAYSDGVIEMPAYVHQRILSSGVVRCETAAKSILSKETDPIVGANQVAEIVSDRPDFQPIYFCRICPHFCLMSTLKEHMVGDKHKIAYLERFHPKECVAMRDMTDKARTSWLYLLSWKIIEKEASLPYPTIRIEYKPSAQDVIQVWGEQALLGTDHEAPKMDLDQLKNILAVFQRPPTTKEPLREETRGPETESEKICRQIEDVCSRAEHSSTIAVHSELSNCDKAIIGANLLVEILCLPTHKLPVYYCKLCDKLCRFNKTTAHLISNRHRMKYMKAHSPAHYAIMKKQNRINRQNFIEAVSVSIQKIENGPLLPELRVYGFTLKAFELSKIATCAIMTGVFDTDAHEGLACTDEEDIGHNPPSCADTNGSANFPADTVTKGAKRPIPVKCSEPRLQTAARSRQTQAAAALVRSRTGIAVRIPSTDATLMDEISTGDVGAPFTANDVNVVTETSTFDVNSGCQVVTLSAPSSPVPRPSAPRGNVASPIDLTAPPPGTEIEPAATVSPQVLAPVDLMPQQPPPPGMEVEESHRPSQPDQWTHQCDAFLSRIALSNKATSRNDDDIQIIDTLADRDSFGRRSLSSSCERRERSSPSRGRGQSRRGLSSRSRSRSLSPGRRKGVLDDKPVDHRVAFMHNDDSMASWFVFMEADVNENVIYDTLNSRPVDYSTSCLLNYGHRPIY